MCVQEAEWRGREVKESPSTVYLGQCVRYLTCSPKAKVESTKWAACSVKINIEFKSQREDTQINTHTHTLEHIWSCHAKWVNCKLAKKTNEVKNSIATNR